MSKLNVGGHPRNAGSGGDASFFFDTALSIYTSRLHRGESPPVAQRKTAQAMARALWDFVQRSDQPVKDFLSILAAPLGSALQSVGDEEALKLASELAAYVKR